VGQIIHKVFICGVLLAVTCGCAVSYEISEDDQTYRRVIGLAQVDVRHAGPDQPTLNGEILIIRGVGLSINRSAQSFNVNLGYTEEKSAYLRGCRVKNLDNSKEPCGVPQIAPTNTKYKTGWLNFAKQAGESPEVRNWTGLVDLYIPLRKNAGTPAGSAHGLTLAGLGYIQTGTENAAVLGYSSGAVLTPGSNTFIRGNPFADLDTLPATIATIDTTAKQEISR